MSRYRSADERRAQLMTAGAELFTNKGFAATTLDDITRLAGVSKGLFYQYFPSKEGLVFALQEKFAAQFATDLTAAAAACADWPGKLDAVVLTCFRRFTGDRGLPGVLFGHVSGDAADSRDPLAPGHRAAHRQLVDAIAAVLGAGVAAGAYQVDDVEATALLFFTTVHAFAPVLRPDIDMADDRLLRATQQLVRGAVGLTTLASTPGPISTTH
ncbi:TetR/AcrR family transcriptional regulator [Frankia sp. AgB32]|uniref:TetR/AcrR family transcriptional regulator n=1 Tax=Frankia sp. AgB32 TaxID=631119 RepID=UPI00200DB6A4|nr:TetR/AcrR family transcriptional regulator [Frankia sp. AgB32]MCK9898308.1 TetR/AcrR family transcriptional regulator [Frankia sp. AgB32]